MTTRMISGDCLVIMDDSGTRLLSIQECFQEPVMILKLDGNITMNAAHDFEDELTSAVTVCNQIEIDFSGVDVISSAGLKTLLSIQQILDQRPNSVLKLKKLKNSVMNTFQETGFAELFEIED